MNYTPLNYTQQQAKKKSEYLQLIVILAITLGTIVLTITNS